MLNFLVRSEIQRVRGAIAEKVGSKSKSLISIFGSPAISSYCRADDCSFIVESETSINVGECRVEYSWSWRLRRGLLFSDWTGCTVDAEKRIALGGVHCNSTFEFESERQNVVSPRSSQTMGLLRKPILPKFCCHEDPWFVLRRKRVCV